MESKLLIDFSSPQLKQQDSPLIPSYQASLKDGIYLSPINFNRPEESNPFDMVVNQVAINTAENDDPFEIALQNALCCDRTTVVDVPCVVESPRKNDPPSIKKDKALSSDSLQGKREEGGEGDRTREYSGIIELDHLNPHCQRVKNGLDDIVPPDSLLNASNLEENSFSSPFHGPFDLDGQSPRELQAGSINCKDIPVITRPLPVPSSQDASSNYHCGFTHGESLESHLASHPLKQCRKQEELANMGSLFGSEQLRSETDSCAFLSMCSLGNDEVFLPTLSEEVFMEANLLAEAIKPHQDIADDCDNYLSSVQQPDWNSFNLPDLDEEEMKLIQNMVGKERRSLLSKEDLDLPKASDFELSPSNVRKSAHRRSQSVGPHLVAPTAAAAERSPNSSPVPLSEDAIRDLSLSSKYSPSKKECYVKNSLQEEPVKKANSMLSQRSFEASAVQTKLVLRKPVEQNKVPHRKGPMKATLPVQSMTRGKACPSPVTRAGKGIQIQTRNYAPCSSSMERKSQSVLSVPSIVVTDVQSSSRHLIPPRQHVPSGIMRPSLRPPAAANQPSRLPSPRRSQTPSAETIQSKRRVSNTPVGLHGSPRPLRKTCFVGTGSAIPSVTPIRRPSSNPRVLADVNSPQVSWKSPARKVNQMGTPRWSRSLVREKENVL